MSIRFRGFLQFAASGTVFGFIIAWYSAQRAASPDFALPGGPFGLLAMVVPGGFALAGLVQSVTGVPFADLSDRWNALKGWQRGVIGTGVFALGLLLLFGGLVAYGLLTEAR
ncbi:hypothetical protein LJR143_002408 [Pseudoxanthomonas sp. LjRoot143]|uniref:hypothetical protein n=1 Tax=unclassified Pseudoxanthomonas TaxID=2645906 RepID=UPI001785D8A8|nr:hypothetical protein [Pseudoxanthomonas sp. PXM01]MBD9469476.1 hypothetical protein [Pseudoxanthomonas sp. PXM01]